MRRRGFLQACWFDGADWFTPGIFLRPRDFTARTKREKWSAEKTQSYRACVERLRQVSRAYQASPHAHEKEMARIATHIVSLWDAVK